MRRNYARLAPSPSSAADVVATALVRVGTTVPFLRSLPPDSYISYDPVSGWRHITVMIDATTQHVPPFSKASYLLRSFLQSDRSHSTNRDGTVAAVVDEASEGCALVHLPNSRRVGDSLRFVERLKKVSSQIMTSHKPLTSSRFRQVVLPEFNPWAGNTIGLVQQQLNKDVRVVAGPCMAAFLTDSTFFKEVRGLLLQQQEAVVTAFGPNSAQSVLPFTADEMPFANLSSDVVDIIHGDDFSVNVTPLPLPSGDAARGRRQFAARSLTFVSGLAATPTSSRSKAPDHFRDQRYFVYDHACKTMFAGEAAGVRMPWATHIVDRYNKKARNMNFPAPSALHYRTTPASFTASSSPGTSASSSGAAAALFSHWSLEESLETASRALSRYNAVQRVLSSSYGELGCDREEVLQRLTSATEALVTIRKRLAAKHFTMGVTHSKAATVCREPLTGPLHKKIWDELIAATSDRVTNTTATTEDATTTTGNRDDTASKPSALQVAARDVMSQLFVADLAAALSASAVHVAPAEGAVQAKIAEAKMASAAKKSSSDVVDDDSAPATTPAASAASTAILEKLFAKRGLQQLGPILKTQDIDVGVFLAMKPDELTATFHVTFGLRKKLEILQTELRSKMGPQ